MTDKTTTNFDDYYAQIPTTTSTEEDASKKKGLKLKVKAKKVEDAPVIENTGAPQEVDTPSVQPKFKVKEKKSTVAII